MRIVHHFHHAQDVGLVDDDAGKAEYAPGGVVRVNGHVDVIFVADGHDALQEIFQVGKKRLVVHAAVHFKQLFDVLHAFRFPAGHDGAVGVAGDGGKHFLRIQLIHGLLGVGEHGGAVRAYAGQLGSGPVEYGHEVVADQMDVCLSQILQGGDVVVDILVAVEKTGLDGVVDVDAFDAGKAQSGVLDLFFQGKDIGKLPHVPGRGVVQGGDHAGHAGDLTDLLQGHGVEAASVPSQCHLHK